MLRTKAGSASEATGKERSNDSLAHRNCKCISLHSSTLQIRSRLANESETEIGNSHDPVMRGCAQAGTDGSIDTAELHGRPTPTTGPATARHVRTARLRRRRCHSPPQPTPWCPAFRGKHANPVDSRRPHGIRTHAGSTRFPLCTANFSAVHALLTSNYTWLPGQRNTSSKPSVCPLGGHHAHFSEPGIHRRRHNRHHHRGQPCWCFCHEVRKQAATITANTPTSVTVTSPRAAVR